MKTLEEIKEEYARENGFDEWVEILFGTDNPVELEDHFDKITKLYVREVSREALKNAVISTKEATIKERNLSRIYMKIYESIENESNIPAL